MIIYIAIIFYYSINHSLFNLITVNKTINMAFYENTVVARQDLAEKELLEIKEKYNLLINSSSGKVIKIENWGLMSLAKKIKKYKKGFYIHFKFEGNSSTLDEIKKKIKIDRSIIRHLIVKYKKLDVENEFFKKDK